MLTPFDEFYFTTSPGYPFRRHNHPHHQRGGAFWPAVNAQPRATATLLPTANYGGLLANVLNEGFRELQQMERELGHVLTNVGGAEVGQLTTEQGGKGGSGYKFSCSVAGYAPEELSVDLEGEELVICGEHKAEGEGQSIHRQFTRRVLLPEAVNKETISCNIDDKGQLEVRAASKELPAAAEKVSIPIGFKESSSNAQAALTEEKGKGKRAAVEQANGVGMRDGQKA